MTILRKRLDDSERVNHTARLFGVHFPLRLEPFIFDMALSHLFTRLSDEKCCLTKM